MKIKMTNKALKDMEYPTIRIGYCGAYYLLNGLQPFAYTCGVYGWNYDAYLVWDETLQRHFMITTGYRGMFGKSANGIVDVDAYNKLAEEIVHNYDIDYESRAYETHKLLCDMARKILE